MITAPAAAATPASRPCAPAPGGAEVPLTRMSGIRRPSVSSSPAAIWRYRRRACGSAAPGRDCGISIRADREGRREVHRAQPARQMVPQSFAWPYRRRPARPKRPQHRCRSRSETGRNGPIRVKRRFKRRLAGSAAFAQLRHGGGSPGARRHLAPQRDRPKRRPVN